MRIFAVFYFTLICFTSGLARSFALLSFRTSILFQSWAASKEAQATIPLIPLARRVVPSATHSILIWAI